MMNLYPILIIQCWNQQQRLMMLIEKLEFFYPHSQLGLIQHSTGKTQTIIISIIVIILMEVVS